MQEQAISKSNVQNFKNYARIETESGLGELPPLNVLESTFNSFMRKLPYISIFLFICIAAMITIDVVGRLFFNRPWVGITDLEVLFMSAIGFLALAVSIIDRSSIQIDLFYERFQPKTKRIITLFTNLLACVASFVLAWRATAAGLVWTDQTGILEISEAPFVILTGIALFFTAIAFLFQTIHSIKRLLALKEYVGICIAVVAVILLCSLPFIYKFYGLRLSGLLVGSLGFLVLMTILLLRMPLGFAMSLIGILGLLIIIRRPEAVLRTIGSIPFTHTANFMIIALPMFMLMGEMIALSGLSADLFKAARMWMGRLPGGLAVASVGGCAGFGAVCGDSMATVMTMSSVALPEMDESKYNRALSTGALAAGGTLGILIPPSMGFIMFSMITEVSVGHLFIAGIIPGILLATIFMAIIMFQVVRNPSWAPKADAVPLKDKLMSLVGVIPVVILFVIIVGGILNGWFTPAEGGAVGAVLSFLYALARGRLTWPLFKETMYRSSVMFGKIFALFIGLYVLGAFLASSRLPLLLADFIAGLDVNRYLILAAIIILYIFLGCVMNIMPMMMLTLPSIFPTIEVLGFDGVWFGVVCVIVMEMGMITPPVGMNVFTLAGMYPDISMATIFRGVAPFFLGMLLCVILVVIFPEIALFMLNTN